MSEEGGEDQEQPITKRTGGTTVEDIMTHDVITIEQGQSVGDAINVFLKHKISGAPVVNLQHKVISVISEFDLMKFVVMGGPLVKVSDYIPKLVDQDDIVAVKKTDPIKSVFQKLLKKPIKRVIVLDATGRLQGIVSRKNILRVFADSYDDDNEDDDKKESQEKTE